MPEAPRIVLADDSVLFREGLARVLADRGFVIAGQAADASELGQIVPRELPDLVITDIRMPPTNSTEGLVAARKIRAEHPRIGVLVLSQYVETRHAVMLLQETRERIGYLLKDRVSDIGEFAAAARRIAAGGSAIDPDVVAQLLRHKRHEKFAGESVGQGTRHLVPDGAGPVEPRDLRAACRLAQDGGDARRVDLHQAGAAARR